MTANVGTIDRVLRIVVGLALIAAALGLFGPAYQTVWGWIGLIPLATGLVSWCPPTRCWASEPANLRRRVDDCAGGYWRCLPSASNILR